MNKTVLRATCIATLLLASSAQANEILNGGFEDGTLGGSHAPNYEYLNTPFHSWTFGGVGIIDASLPNNAWWNGSTWGPTGFTGSRYAFMQGPAQLSQTFTASSTGTALLTWLESSRPYNAIYKGDQTYNVLLNGLLKGSFTTVSGQNFEAESLSLGALTQGSTYTLAFVGTNLVDHGDNTAFLDQIAVDITPQVVPEPTTAALLGLAAAALGLRRRT